MTPNPGFAAYPAPARPTVSALAPLYDLQTSLISDSLARMCGAVGLRPFHRAGRMVGPAFTVRVRPGDNLMFQKALDLAEPGDIIVVDGGGDLINALAGELMMLHAVARKLGGFVVDGAVRDSAAFAAGDFPCFARGVSHRGPYKDGPGEINVPVSIGGMVVHPGDIVVGDEDGVLAFPAAQLAEVIALATARGAAEEKTRQSTKAGNSDRRWIDEALMAKGYTAPKKL